MAKSSFTPEQSNLLSRNSIKQLIKKYNDSKGQDKATLSLIIEQLARTPLYFAVEKDSDVKNASSLRFVTLNAGGKKFITIFTGPDDFGKLADTASAVCLSPETYFKILIDNNADAVINPFGSYFLMWPELVRDYMLPFLQETQAFRQQDPMNTIKQ